MLEARARAKSQMGAAGTSLEFEGNNPLKFARTPEQALTQLLNPAERGFMPADRAVEDAFRDLQAHQLATLKAMQGALRATLDRFSPTAISKRAGKPGGLRRSCRGRAMPRCGEPTFASSAASPRAPTKRSWTCSPRNSARPTRNWPGQAEPVHWSAVPAAQLGMSSVVLNQTISDRQLRCLAAARKR